jgi:acyl dehydratase
MKIGSESPYFDDLDVGDIYEDTPPITMTEGLAAVHQSIVGDRLRLFLDHELCNAVTNRSVSLVSPSLIWDIAIGQSTTATHRVIANLFYRGLGFRRFPEIGDTLRTRTEVAGLRETSARPGRETRGLAALRITSVDQHNRIVLDFWRCAMLPLRNPGTSTGRADDLETIGDAVLPERFLDAVRTWDLVPFRDSLRPHVPRDLPSGTVLPVIGGDVVSNAPELARLTLNIAQVHHDDFTGSRLVYGGHTIALALTQAARILPELVTVVAWHGCDHLGPVHEGDTLTSEIIVEAEHTSLETSGRLVNLRSIVRARSGPGQETRPVLDWRYTALLA